MAQQQVPQVQIPMAPPVPQQVIPGIQMAPSVDVGQINIPQPTTSPVAPFPNSDNFTLRSPEQVVFGQAAQGLPEQVVPEPSGPYKLPDVPKYQVELNAPPTVRGEGQSRFEADVEGITRNMNTRVLYDNAVQPLASGGLPSKGGMDSTSILGGGLINRAKGYFTDNVADEAARELTVKAREYFDRDDVRASIEADPEALALLQRDPIGYYQALTSDTVDSFIEEKPFTFEQEVPKPEGVGIPKAEQELLDGKPAVSTTQPAVSTTQPAATGGSNLTQQDAEEAETVITTPVKTDADAVLKGAGNAPKEDAPPEEKEGFLKKLWGGMKDMFKEGMEDPAFRKTLFAYVGSRALGYDGVTFAGQVLENEWKVQAAERKQEFELEKIYGKEGLATLKAQKKAKAIDPSKVATIYDKTTETNLTGAFSADGTMVRLDNANFYESLGIEPDANGVYPVLSVAAVRAAQGGGRFSVGVGLTGNDIISGIRDNIDLDVEGSIATYVSNQNLDTEDAEKLTTKLNDAINGTVRNGAAKAFKSFYPAGTDFSDFNLQEVSTNAVIKYIDSVGRGMEGNSKNLAAFMEKERLKVETKYSVSPSFFKVVGDDSEDAIGGEAWSKATAKVKYLASAFGKEIGANKSVPKVAMWSNLERLYNKQSEEMGPDFKIFWESESEDSADEKGQGASPALLWVMSIDRNKSTTGSKYFAGSMQDVMNKMK